MGLPAKMKGNQHGTFVLNAFPVPLPEPAWIKGKDREDFKV